ncbi:MAG: hypothetical protein IJY23_01105 [Clostridia bacterium]|nr:hypothetical protein [Clostridia bacterium]
MLKQKIFNRRACAFLIVALLLFELMLMVIPVSATTEDNIDYLDDTTIYEDFESVGISTSYYPRNLKGKPQYMYFTESCYSDRGSNLDEYFSLYIWIYNPTETELNVNGVNVVNISFDGETYSNQLLTFVSCTDNHRFYKFRFSNTKDILENVRNYAEKNDGTRIYKIAGIQVQEGTLLPTDTEVGVTFTFGGYAKGCHPSSKSVSTLTCSKESLDTIALNVNHTSYRKDERTDYYLFYYDKDDDGITTADEARDILGIMTEYEYLAEQYVAQGYKRFNSIDEAINAGAIYHEYYPGSYSKAYHSVYFGLPETYVEEYAALKQITSEWYKYRTAPIFVTSNTDAYQNLNYVIAQNVGEGRENVDWRVLWEYGEQYNTLGTGTSATTFGSVYKHAYNAKKDGEDYWADDWYTFSNSWSYLPSINWLFKVTEKPESWDDYKVSSAQLENYMKSYSAYKTKDVLGRFNSALFDGDCLEHFEGTITSDDYIKDLSVVDRPWWQFWKPTEYEDVSPIHCLTESEMSDILALNASSVEDIKSFEDRFFIENDNTGSSSGNVLKDFQDMIKSGTVPVIFRFADSEYYASTACFDNYSSDIDYYSESNGYVAQESVFLNFDIISLGFQTKDGGNALAIIPVVANPIDIIPSLVAPEDIPIEEVEWWQKIIALLSIIVIGIVALLLWGPIKILAHGAFNVIKLIFGIVWSIATWPFRQVWRLLSRGS